MKGRPPLRHRVAARLFVVGEDEADTLAHVFTVIESQGFDRARTQIAALFEAIPHVKQAILELKPVDLVGPADPDDGEPPVEKGSPAIALGQARDLLATHGGNVSAAARAANLPRATFRYWLSQEALSVAQDKTAPLIALVRAPKS